MAARRSVKRPAKSKRLPAARSLNNILIDLGKRALQDGVREVLVDHGIDESVKVELALTKPRRVPAKKVARKPVRRRSALNKAVS